MAFFEKFLTIERKFAWGFTGVILAILFFAAGIYVTIFYEKKPRLRFEVRSQEPVFSVRENVSKLQILYDSQDVRQNHEMLSLMSIRILNSGNSDITKNLYDENSPPGFAIKGGKVITVEPTDASNGYIREQVQFRVTLDPNAWTFRPIILERDQWFTAKVLVLHPEDKKPQVETFGKVAGIQQFELTETANTERPSFLRRVFGGDVIIQISRALSYFFGTAILLIGGTLAGTAMTESYQKRRRKRYARRFRGGFEGRMGKKESGILDRYVKEGEPFLLQVCTLLRDSDALRQVLTTPEPPLPAGIPSDPFSDVPVILANDLANSFSHRRTAQFLSEQKIVTVEGETTTVDGAVVDFVNRFEAFLLALVPRRIRHMPRTDQDRAESGSETEGTPPPTTP